MIVVLERLWPALAAAGGLGFLLAVALGPGHGAPSATWGGRAAALLVVVALGLVAGLGLASGRVALWLETASLIVAAYAAGCIAGALLRAGFGRMSSGPPGHLGGEPGPTAREQG